MVLGPKIGCVSLILVLGLAIGVGGYPHNRAKALQDHLDRRARQILPRHLVGTRHRDYLPGFRWIPRGWTAFSWGVPEKIAGTQRESREDSRLGFAGPAPIGEAGSWQVSRFPEAPGPLKYLPLYFAATTKTRRHFRVGFRWDDVDGYVNGPSLATRCYSGELIEHTSP